MALRVWVAVFLLLPDPSLIAAVCATPGRDGSATLTGVVNGYWPGTASAAAGATSITLGAAARRRRPDRLRRPAPRHPDAGRGDQLDEHRRLRRRRRGRPGERLDQPQQLGPLRIRAGHRRRPGGRRHADAPGNRRRRRPPQRLHERGRDRHQGQRASRSFACRSTRPPRCRGPDGGRVERSDRRHPGDRRFRRPQPRRRDRERRRPRLPRRRRAPAYGRHRRREHGLRPGLDEELRRRRRARAWAGRPR